jgi:hypothetical protein
MPYEVLHRRAPGTVPRALLRLRKSTIIIHLLGREFGMLCARQLLVARPTGAHRAQRSDSLREVCGHPVCVPSVN